MDKTDKNSRKPWIKLTIGDDKDDRDNCIKCVVITILIVVGLIVFYAFEAWVKSLI
jgi:hypothetical protein